MNTRAQEAELVAKAKAGDPDAYARLLDDHRGVIAKWTHQYAGDFARLNHAEDLASEGVRAFALSLQKFDPDRGTRLVTVLRFAVRRYVLEYLQRENRLRRGDPATGEPIVVSLDHAPGTAGKVCDPDAPVSALSPGVQGAAGSVDPGWAASVMEYSGWAAPSDGYGAELHERLASSLKLLSPQVRHLLTLRYTLRWSLEKIMARGYAKPVTRGRVERDLSRAITFLRASMGP